MENHFPRPRAELSLRMPGHWFGGSVPLGSGAEPSGSQCSSPGEELLFVHVLTCW